jgi:ABC-2 type transport system ATP-binding protein
MPTPRPVPSVLLTTHYLEEAQALASRVVVLAGGRVIAQGGVDDITAQVGLSRVHLRAPSRPELPVGTQVESSNGSHTLYTADPTGWSGCSRSRVAFTGLRVERVSLERPSSV